MRRGTDARILRSMQTADSWAAWRRAGVSAVRSVRAMGILHPAPLLCAAVGLLLCSVLLGGAALGELRRSVAAEAQAFVELQPAAADQDVQELYAALRQLPAVASAQLISKEQALSRERERHPDLAAFLDRYQIHNPFADAFSVRLRTAGDFPALRAALQDPHWNGVIDAAMGATLAEQEQSLLRLQEIVDLLARTGFAVAAFLLLLTLVITTDMTLARLLARAEERRTVTLLGGGWVDSDGPVLLEMSLVLWGAFACAAAVFMACITVLPSFLGGHDPLVAAFLAGVRRAAFGILPAAAFGTAVLVPVAASLAWALARFRLRRVHG